MLAPGWDVRTRVIEYGGRPWLALGDRAEDGIVFTHGPDQRVYRWQPGGDPVPLSPAGAWPGELRYADFAVRGAEVWCMRETVGDERAVEAVRHLVALPLDGRAATDPGAVRELAATHHFMTGPRIEPGGDRVAWLGWDHPDMPWDTTDLMVAEIRADATLARALPLMGGRGSRSPRPNGPPTDPAPSTPSATPTAGGTSTRSPRTAGPATSARARRSSARRCGGSACAGAFPCWTAGSPSSTEWASAGSASSPPTAP